MTTVQQLNAITKHFNRQGLTVVSWEIAPDGTVYGTCNEGYYVTVYSLMSADYVDLLLSRPSRSYASVLY